MVKFASRYTPSWCLEIIKCWGNALLCFEMLLFTETSWGEINIDTLLALAWFGFEYYDRMYKSGPVGPGTLELAAQQQQSMPGTNLQSQYG